MESSRLLQPISPGIYSVGNTPILGGKGLGQPIAYGAGNFEIFILVT